MTAHENISGAQFYDDWDIEAVTADVGSFQQAHTNGTVTTNRITGGSDSNAAVSFPRFGLAKLTSGAVVARLRVGRY